MDVRPDLLIHDNFLPRSMIEAAYEVLPAFTLPSSMFYLSIKHLDNGSGEQQLAQYLPSPLVTFILRHLSDVLTEVVPWARRKADGFEFWVGVTTRVGGRAQLHCDVDEVLRRAEGVIRCPSIGTILHLGPSSDVGGGETLFDLGVTEPDGSERCFALAPWPDLIAACIAPMVVPRRQGRLIVFRGHVPHAVAPMVCCSPAQPRVALLTNLWDQRPLSIPTGVSCLTPEAYASLGAEK